MLKHFFKLNSAQTSFKIIAKSKKKQAKSTENLNQQSEIVKVSFNFQN